MYNNWGQGIITASPELYYALEVSVFMTSTCLGSQIGYNNTNGEYGIHEPVSNRASWQHAIFDVKLTFIHSRENFLG